MNNGTGAAAETRGIQRHRKEGEEGKAGHSDTKGKTGMVALVVERGGRRQVNREEEREEGQITSRIFEKVTRNHVIFIYLSLHLICVHAYTFNKVVPFGLTMLPEESLAT